MACAVTVFFRSEAEGIGLALPGDFEPQNLLLPHVQEHFRAVLQAGGSELSADEIDWGQVAEVWELTEKE